MAVEASPTTILLIESDQALRRRYRKFLEFAGFRVITWESLQDFQARPVADPTVDVAVLREADTLDPAWQAWVASHPETHVIPVAESCATFPTPSRVLPSDSPPERLVSHIRRLLGPQLRLCSCA